MGGGHWGGAMCNINPATDPAQHHRNDRKCIYGDGTKTKNGCTANMPTLYPGTHRCFQSGPIVDGGPGGHWGGSMCNIDPATDPVPHHRNDRKCDYTPGPESSTFERQPALSTCTTSSELPITTTIQIRVAEVISSYLFVAA